MKHSYRLFAAIFFVSITALAVSEAEILRRMSSQAETDYVRQYENYSQQIGDTLTQLDAVAELVMQNAASVLREREKEHGLPTTAELKKLRDDLHLFNLYITDDHGRFIRSTFTFPIEKERPLFSYCEGYRGLIDGRSAIAKTPILRGPDYSWPFKFLMIPNHDRTRVIEASMAMGFVGETLENAMKPDTNIVSVGLFTPSGNVLGYIHSRGTKETEHTTQDLAPVSAEGPQVSKSGVLLYGVKEPIPSEFDATTVSFGAPQASKSGFVFYRKVLATAEDCCECRTKGLTLPDGKYFYILRTEVSRAGLDATLAGIRGRFLFIGLIALILSGVMAYVISRRLAQAELASAEKEKALVELARQVAHDIRSPLAALDAVVERVARIPEDDRIRLRGAANRIKDIANDLLEKNRRRGPGPSGGASASAPEDSSGVHLVSGLIDPLITEKRMQYRSKIGVDIHSQIDSESYGLFANVNPTEFQRVFSNLVNNAVEALEEKGTVWVRLSTEGDRLRLEIRDDGKGIPPEILGKLGRRDETHGKPDGSGLGLHHARTAAESWGGSLDLRSEAGRGTTAILTIPRARPPKWFASTLELDPAGAVVVLDDDTSIHQVWQGRFDSLKAGDRPVDARHFSTPDELRDWVRSDAARAGKAVYLLDYELLGHKDTGLSLIAELGLGGRAILVTSRFEEKAIREECLRLGARMIPKGLAGFVPIRLPAAVSESRLEAALIDDDELTRYLWESGARKAGKSFKAYADAASFLADLEKGAVVVTRDAALYVDSSLGDGIKGEDVARDLHRRGFTNIRLATGYDPSEFPAMDHVREVVGKNSPWG